MRKFYQHVFLPQCTHYFSSKIYVALISWRFFFFAKACSHFSERTLRLFLSLLCHPEKTSPMTSSNQNGRLHPFSKTRRLLTETTLVSPLSSRDGKFDDMQRPTWSSAPFVKDAMYIDRDYFSLSFVILRRQVR